MPSSTFKEMDEFAFYFKLKGKLLYLERGVGVDMGVEGEKGGDSVFV